MDSVCFEVPESLAFEGFRVSRSRCRVSGFMVARSRVFGVGFRVKASGLRGVRVRIQGLETGLCNLNYKALILEASSLKYGIDKGCLGGLGVDSWALRVGLSGALIASTKSYGHPFDTYWNTA